MTKPPKTVPEAQASAGRRAWQRPKVRRIRAGAAETGGASPQTDLGVTFS
jgi:hypothetical protein